MSLVPRNHKQRIGRFLATGVALSALLFGSLAVTQSAQAARQVGGTLKLAFDHEAGSFDPAKATLGMSHAIIEQVYSGLTALDANANPYPDLADTIDISDDGMTYTFNLKKGVTFHDGSPFTAEDVKFTIDRLKDPETAYPYVVQLTTIQEVVVLGSHTVQLQLSEPTGPLLVSLAFPGSLIVSKNLFEAGHDFNATPIGTGPYKFVSYQLGTSIKLERNANYHEGNKPFIANLEYQIISDQTAITNAVQTGVVNFSNVIPAKDWAAVEANPNLTGQAVEGGRWFWLMLNNQNPPLDNKLVRQALAHAMDRQALVDAVFYGLAKVIQGGVVPEWSWGYAKDLKTFSTGADPDKAKALLAEAGYADGFDLVFKVGTEWPRLMAMAPIIQANLQAVGINAKITTMGTSQWMDEVWGGKDFHISDMYWLSPLADPEDFTSLNYLCDSPMNAQQSCSKELDAILNEARSGTTLEARKDAYIRAQELAATEMPLAPLVSALILHAHTNKLKGFVPMRTGFLKTLKDAWLED